MLFPAISMASTSPVSRQTPSSSRPSLPTGDWWSPPALASPLSTHFASQVGIGPKVGFIHEEDLGSTLLGLLSDLAVLEDEGFPFFILGFQEAFLGSLQHEAQPMEVVQATAPTQPQVKALLEKLPYYFPVPVGQFNPRLPRRILHRRLQFGSVDLGSRRGGTPSLLKDQTLGPALAKVVQPVSDGMRLSLQSLRPLEWPTTLGPTTIAHAIALAPEVLAPDTSFPVSRLHPVATVPGVALCLSSLPPPPIDFFYRISQLLFGFAFM